ncbi:rootletin-like isoform X7 [Narcine bancroftii]|uniref:rootletin-like isoform X7 n=1 Tax=Narcine bancroftii TaxID=1343680 RepID=UPI003831C27F
MSLCRETGAEEGCHLEAVIQALQNTVQSVENGQGFIVWRDSEGSPLTCLPAKIREIITKNFMEEQASVSPLEMSSVLPLQEENCILQQELSRVEDLLAQSRAERDELAIKYNAISERLEKTLRLETGERERECLENKSLAQQNVELRRHLEEEQASYKRKLQAYQEGQQRQAQLVQKLQSKVLQYKKKCSDVEQQLVEKATELEQHRLSSRLDLSEVRLQRCDEEQSNELENALIRLEEEQQRSASLAQVNSMLREQLDQANCANVTLSEDIRKLTSDWAKAREELEQKELDWRHEEETFNLYFSNEHTRLLTLWRQVVGFKRHFCQIKSASERDLSELRNDLAKSWRTIHASCLNLSGHLCLSESSSAAALERQGVQLALLERQLRDKVREMLQLQAKSDQEKAEQNARITELMVTVERLQTQNNEKEKAISALSQSVETLESSHAGPQAVPDSAQFESAKAEVESLHQTLRDIAQVVISDADSGTQTMSGEVAEMDSSLFSSLGLPTSRRTASPRRRASPRYSLSPAFTDSLFSAVQGAVKKRQLQIQELRAKYEAAQDMVAGLKKHLADSESGCRALEQKTMKLKEEAEELARAKDDSKREANRFRSSADLLGSEKSNLEKSLQSLQQQLEMVQQDNEKLQMANSELQRQRDNLEDEKEDLLKDKERALKEIERGNKVSGQLEDKNSNMKTELVQVKEALMQASLDKEVQENEKAELKGALSKVQSANAEKELILSKLRTEQASLRDSLSKLSAFNEVLAQDKVQLNKIILELEDEKTMVLGQKKEIEQEKMSIRDELVRLEQEKLDLHNEYHSLEYRLQILEQTRGKLEQDLLGFQQEKGELQEQLGQATRQKNSVNQELVQAQHEIERQNEALLRVAKEKEELTRLKASLEVQLTSSERENRVLVDEGASLRSEKEALETALFDTRQWLTVLETQKEQAEGENQTLLLAKETLQAERSRIRKEMEVELSKMEHNKEFLTQKLSQAEHETRVALKNEQTAHEEDVDRLHREKEALRLDLEEEREELVQQLKQEREELCARFEAEKEELSEEIVTLQQERDETLLMAENEKQQILSLKESEKAILSEKLTNTQRELAIVSMDVEQLKHNAHTRNEQDRQSQINSLTSELKDFHARLEEAVSTHAQETRAKNEQLQDLRRQYEARLREVEELKTQLQLVEDTRDGIRRDLIEAHRRIREQQETQEVQCKEILDLKRLVSDEVKEKEAVQQSNEELRCSIRKTEAERISLKRSNEEKEQKISVLEDSKANSEKESADLRASLREVEKSHLEARRELQDLRRQVKTLDGENMKKSKEIVDLQTRLTLDEQREEENRHESFELKHKLLQTEASRESAQKELANLQRKIAEAEHEFHIREKELVGSLEEAQGNGKKLLDNARNLDLKLEKAQVEIHELCLKVSAAEGRVSGLEGELARLEGQKRDMEFKLSCLHSTLRRTLGINRTGRTQSPVIRGQSASPHREQSPTKGLDNTFASTTESQGSPIPHTRTHERSTTSRPVSPERSLSPSRSEQFGADIDPEVVRASLRAFLQELRDTQRDRDEARVQGSNLSRQLRELESDRDNISSRLQQLQKSLAECEEGKKGIDGRLTSAQAALILQEETIRRNERERKALLDKITTLERSVQSADTDRRTRQDKMSKMRANEVKLESNKRKLKEALDVCESRITKLELARRSLEGALQRERLVTNDRQAETQLLQECVEALRGQVADGHAKAGSLQLTVDRLNSSLAKAEEGESQLKDKVQSLSLALSDKAASASALKEKAQQLQKALNSSEHDRRILQPLFQFHLFTIYTTILSFYQIAALAVFEFSPPPPHPYSSLDHSSPST